MEIFKTPTEKYCGSAAVNKRIQFKRKLKCYISFHWQCFCVADTGSAIGSAACTRCCCGRCAEIPDWNFALIILAILPKGRKFETYDRVMTYHKHSKCFRSHIHVTPSFCASTYRNVVLWHHGCLRAGRRVVVPSCVCHVIRIRLPEDNPLNYFFFSL